MALTQTIFHCPQHGQFEVRIVHGDVLRCPYCTAEAKMADYRKSDDAQMHEEIRAIGRIHPPKGDSDT